MKKYLWISSVLLASALTAGAAVSDAVSGAFIQFNRAAAERSLAQWQATLDRMRTVGCDLIIVQWTAEDSLLYFKDKNLAFSEQCEALERLMEAARIGHFGILLGLQHDPAFWNEITARDKALRDYFLVRQAQHQRLQAALLKAFGQREDWIGYYIPDEIDDLSWREPQRRQLLQDYLRATVKSLREHDRRRAVAISTFFRGRTAPSLLAENLQEITGASGLDYLLLQDGAGNDDPPSDILPLYYKALLERQQNLPELWAVLEAFRQTSGPQQPFAAVPAPSKDFLRQIKAADQFKRRLLFSFPDYVDPTQGTAAQELYYMLNATP